MIPVGDLAHLPADDPVVCLPRDHWERIVARAREFGMTDVDRMLQTGWGRGAIIAYVIGYLEAGRRDG